MNEKKESFILIKYLYEQGIYPIDKMCDLVESKEISEEEFH